MIIGPPFPALPAVLLACLAASGCDRAPSAPPRQVGAKAVPTEPVILAPEIADFYRDHRPIWVADGALRPGALALIRRIADAANDGLDPERYGASELAAAEAAARGGDKRALARTELLLSRAYAAFVRDLRTPAAPTGMKYVDAGLAPETPSARDLLEAAAAAPSLSGHVAEATAMNPLYESLRRGYAGWRARPGRRDGGEEALIRANLDRARAIPALPGRYVVVDTASARLWMIDGRRVEGPMKVIVGKPHMQTPVMAALMRYVTLNPYWNMPPDLARERARKVQRQGTGLIARERLQILSDWGDNPRLLSASQVDWGAVASGRRSLRLRQLPGGANVMGAVKFMLPNEMGIYLHDFPDKSLFARADRRLSSGCVRLSDAPRLARWLYRGEPPRPAGDAPEQDVALPEPVPVYIAYLTVLPDGRGGLTFQPDSYARDRDRPTRQAAIRLTARQKSPAKTRSS
jgi:murein L,D-transpeptidase YcbB/YkuD